ncbi:MAG: type II secretion system protein [Nitrospirae bacterium]|nr:type II secretion system protein [Nitrospirota bacterium]
MKAQRGFTLLEVLAAVAILGMALTVILQLFSANLGGISASDSYLAASLAADAKMREVVAKDDFAEKAWSETTEEGYRMDISIKPALGERTESLPVQLHEITLSVRFESGARERTFTLRTLRVTARSI